jgi:hypothetical protein
VSTIRQGSHPNGLGLTSPKRVIPTIESHGILLHSNRNPIRLEINFINRRNLSESSLRSEIRVFSVGLDRILLLESDWIPSCDLIVRYYWEQCLFIRTQVEGSDQRFLSIPIIFGAGLSRKKSYFDLNPARFCRLESDSRRSEFDRLLLGEGSGQNESESNHFWYPFPTISHQLPIGRYCDLIVPCRISLNNRPYLTSKNDFLSIKSVL